MKFVTKTLLLSNALSAAAFAPPRPQHKKHNNPSFQQQLKLFPDPSTLESSTLLTADVVDAVSSGLGSLVLLGSIGYGVMTGINNEDWDYEYKAGNEYGDDSDLAIIGVSPEEVAEDMAKVGAIRFI